MRFGLLAAVLAMFAACEAAPSPDDSPDAALPGSADAALQDVPDAAMATATVVATANIRCLIDDWDQRLPLLVAEIERVRPDVLALQEVCRDTQTGRDALTELLDALSLDYTAARAQTHLAWDRYEEGIAVLALDPVLSSTVVDLPAGAFPRRAVIARIAAPSGPLVFAGTHLSFGDERAATRAAQLAAVRAAVDTVRGPCDTAVVTGDFNESPNGAAVTAALTHGYADAWAEAHPGDAGATVPSDDPSARIDYILVSAGNAVAGHTERFLDVSQGAIYPSDHLGVWSELNSSSCPNDS